MVWCSTAWTAIGAGVLCALALAACSTAPDATPPPQYVSRSVCAECHAEAVAAWTGSDHDLAMAPATSETVLGDFDDATFTQHGVTTRFFRDGDRFRVATEGPTGAIDTFDVAYTFGVRPLQQYLVPFPDGRMQALTVAWDTERERWYSLYPDERIPPGDWLHWTGRGMTWNYMCADCHSTDLQKNFDLASNTYHTTYEEVDVSCEACHGPGEAHVAWARATEEERADRPDMGLTVRLNSARQIDTCAPCHARRRVVTADFTPGDTLLNHYLPELLEEGLYFPDGQILDEVYVYGSFLQSKMYQQNVRCTDCHDPHTMRLKLEGNALCGQCHAAPIYDAPAHHFHPEGTESAACVSCHMPERTYMGVDPRRDHSFKVPRPDLSVDLGVPNACTGCHTEETDAWAAAQVEAWYGPDRPATPARAVAAGRHGDPAAEPELVRIAGTDTLAPITRATVLALLGGYSGTASQVTIQAGLTDADPLVRIGAIRAMERRPPDEQRRALAPLLVDEVRSVRIEAARVLALVGGLRPEQLPAAQAPSFQEALAEYRRSQETVGDQPEAQLNLAVLHEHLDQPDQADAAYQAALRLDSTFAPARVNRAMLLDRRRQQAREAGRTAEAQALAREIEQELRTALRHQPELAEAHYSLGLFLAEDANRLAEAAEHLSRAAALAPAHPRIQYNTGLIYQHLGQPDEAAIYLRAALDLEPRNPDFLYALAVLHMQQEQWREALRYTDALLEVLPGTPQLMQQRAYIVQQLDR